MTIEVRVNNVFPFLETLKRAKEISPKGFQPEFTKLGQQFKGFIAESFATERDPYGNPWYPLARTTVTDKIQRGVNNGILKETGAYSKSFQYRALANGVRVFSNHVFDDGTPGDIHQEGGIHPETGYAIPARSMLPDMGNLPPRWQDAINSAIDEGINRLFR